MRSRSGGRRPIPLRHRPRSRLRVRVFRYLWGDYSSVKLPSRKLMDNQNILFPVIPYRLGLTHSSPFPVGLSRRCAVTTWLFFRIQSYHGPDIQVVIFWKIDLRYHVIESPILLILLIDKVGILDYRLSLKTSTEVSKTVGPLRGSRGFASHPLCQFMN